MRKNMGTFDRAVRGFVVAPIAIGAIVGVGVLVVRTRGIKLHERLMAGCERMFERMPDTFPPKQALRGIDEIRSNTARIADVLESRAHDGTEAPHAA
jgi:hypothetical protein